MFGIWAILYMCTKKLNFLLQFVISTKHYIYIYVAALQADTFVCLYIYIYISAWRRFGHGCCQTLSLPSPLCSLLSLCRYGTANTNKSVGSVYLAKVGVHLNGRALIWTKTAWQFSSINFLFYDAKDMILASRVSTTPSMENVSTKYLYNKAIWE